MNSNVATLENCWLNTFGMPHNILRSYRELLSLVQRLPKEKQASAIQEAKAKILAHQGESDSLKISDLHKQLVAKISFLRMTTSRRPGERSRPSSGTFVLREGDLVESASEREQRCRSFAGPSHRLSTQHADVLCSCRVANGQVSMDEFKQRHHQLLRRQHFGREPPVTHNKIF